MKAYFFLFFFVLVFPIEGFAKHPVSFHVERGASLDQTARRLKSLNLIENVFYFKLLAVFSRSGKKIKAGEYLLEQGLSSWEILNILVEGRSLLYPVTFREGLNLYEMARILQDKNLLKEKDFISLCHEPGFIYELIGEKRPSIEGYLFPDTYYVSRPVRPQRLIRKMVKAFWDVYGGLNQKGASAGGGIFKLTRHEAVILASIVEKETGLARERPLIAGVFLNRLQKKMRLQSDPTILYGMMLEAGGLMPFNIRKRDILRKTPYNTYSFSGFPKGPVANPGKEALRSVFEPEKSSFLYFVSRNDGAHVFSKTYKEHKKAVDYWQKKLK